jgi:hypothetical protein
LALLLATPARGAEPPLAEVLDHVGRQMEKFWSYFASVTCTETVTQSKLGDRDKVLFAQHESFDYLISLQSSGLDISVDESRLQKSHAASKGSATLLETNGFSIFSLIFHPLYQDRFEFQPLPDDLSENHRLLCVAFRQVGSERPLSVLRLREREYPLAWRGTAWIDPATWAVVRIKAGLGDSMADFGLLQLDADVTYSAVKFSDSTVYWLPVRAIIDAETKRQHWRNTHLFAGYKRFAVETDIKLATPSSGNPKWP